MAAKQRQDAVGGGEQAGGILVWGPLAPLRAIFGFGAEVVVVETPVRILGSGTDVSAAGLPASFVVAALLRAAATLPVVPLTWSGRS